MPNSGSILGHDAIDAVRSSPHPTTCCLCTHERIRNFVPFLRLARSAGGTSGRITDLDRLPDLAEIQTSPDASLRAALGRVVPIVHARLTSTAAGQGVAEDLRTHIRSHALETVARHMFQERRIRHILEQSRAEGIPVMLLKAAAFQESLYCHSAPRVGGDFDFLVKQSDFSRMCDLMGRNMTEVFDRKRRYSHETAFQWMFQSADRNDPIVEIHRAITSPYVFSICEDDLWASSVPHPAFRSDLIRILSPEHNILHLAVHAFRDLDFCTHNLLDAHEIWCQWKPNNALLIEQSRAWGANGALYYLLINLRQLMDTPVPTELIQRLAQSRFRRAINERIFTAPIIRSGDHFHPAYRMIQAISQVSVPDKSLRGLCFHFDYARTRVMDLYLSLKNG